MTLRTNHYIATLREIGATYPQMEDRTTSLIRDLTWLAVARAEKSRPAKALPPAQSRATAQPAPVAPVAAPATAPKQPAKKAAKPTPAYSPAPSPAVAPMAARSTADSGKDPADVRGTPGAWVAPVSKSLAAIQEIANRQRFAFGTVNDLPAFNRFRVSQGYPPLAVHWPKHMQQVLPGRLTTGVAKCS